jgi:hypothetical protein
MKTKIAIYLAGSIKKGHERDDCYWTNEDMALIRKNLHAYDVTFLNPAFRSDDLGDHCSVFGRDMLQVFTSNFVFVDARNRRGLGVGAEMMWAKVNRIPVVTWAPKDSHYHKENTTVLDIPVPYFLHPFVGSLSDIIVENITEGTTWIDFVMQNPDVKIKDIQHVSFSIEHYQKSQLHNDIPMRELFLENEYVKTRASRSHPEVSLKC